MEKESKRCPSVKCTEFEVRQAWGLWWWKRICCSPSASQRRTSRRASGAAAHPVINLKFSGKMIRMIREKDLEKTKKRFPLVYIKGFEKIKISGITTLFFFSGKKVTALPSTSPKERVCLCAQLMVLVHLLHLVFPSRRFTSLVNLTHISEATVSTVKSFFTRAMVKQIGIQPWTALNAKVDMLWSCERTPSSLAPPVFPPYCLSLNSAWGRGWWGLTLLSLQQSCNHYHENMSLIFGFDACTGFNKLRSTSLEKKYKIASSSWRRQFEM